MQLVFEHQTDFVLLCASGVMGVASTCVVLQFGSIQLVQVRWGLCNFHANQACHH